MEVSKIQLSGAELDLVCNAEIILTKNSIITKTIGLLETLQEQMLADVQAAGEKGGRAFHVSPKISRGENYRGLPYVVLDYPRVSAGDDLLFIRNMFWWGNHFSTTLQAGGRYKAMLLANILAAYPLLAREQYYVGVNPDPWQHHFGEDNYQPISGLSEKAFAMLLEAQPHIKIAALWPLENWNRAAMHMYDSWKQLSALITKAV